MILIRRLSVLRGGFVNVGLTASIIAGSFTLLHLGYFVLTVDGAISLALALIYQFTQRKRTKNFLPSSASEKLPGETDSNSTQDRDQHEYELRTVASVVGWREDEGLYAGCLRGVSGDSTCAAVVAGIDGNEAEDEPMVDVFQRVYPGGVVIRLDEPLSEQLRKCTGPASPDLSSSESSKAAMDILCQYVRDTLTESLFPARLHDVKAICIVQPHRSKKDILFTTLTFATVLSQEIGVEYIFSTDSDTHILPETVGKMTARMASDEKTGGVSGHLRFFHHNETIISRMTSSQYWFKQEVAKVQGAMWGTTDCQPGACASFRVNALRPVLIPWYGQSILGVKMITNEDRHLTTCIIQAGYSVHYAPDAIVYSHTPNTVADYIKQQVRWARGQMLETLWYPRILSRLPPWYLYDMVKGRLVPVGAFWTILSLAIYGDSPRSIRDFFVSAVFVDVCCCYSLQVAYVVFLGPDETSVHDLLWFLPSMLWYYVTMPPIVIWSMLTMFNESWGTSMRAVSPSREKGTAAYLSYFSNMTKEVAFVTAWVPVVLVAVIRSY